MIELWKRALARTAGVAASLGMAVAMASAAAPALAASAHASAAQLSPDDPAYPLTRPNPEAEIAERTDDLESKCDVFSC